LRTAFLHHRACQDHDTGADHPECARRLTSIEDRLISSGLGDFLHYVEAPQASDEQLLRVHSRAHLERVTSMIPATGFERLDPDTIVSSASLTAARHAAGAVIEAVDLVAKGEVNNAFCSVRPPGHHAERVQAMGFCLFNNLAVGAAHAMEHHDFKRVAIVDFDVHHGNGTEDIFRDEQRVLFCSTFQHPFFPFTPLLPDAPQRVSVPLAATAGSAEFRTAVSEQWLPALKSFAPDIVFVSAGFDAHVADDMSHVNLTDADYRWITEQVVAVANATADGRIVSVLEGGYEFHSLARCVELHLRILSDLY